MKKLLAIVVCLLLLGTITAGCTFAKPDPQNTITQWISAVNNHDYPKIYYLAPLQIQQQESLQDFLLEQNNNSFLNSGGEITDYKVLSKDVQGDTATYIVELIMRPSIGQNGSGESVPVYIKFEEIFQNGEWRVWTTSP